MGSFNTVNGKYYCNNKYLVALIENLISFNTVNGKYYCNTNGTSIWPWRFKFQYRKR